MMTDREILVLIEGIEREAAELMLHAHGIISENKTGSRDVVTEYDRRIQQLIISRITDVIPNAAFFCEEMAVQQDVTARHLFIIDPIDGTMNFVRGFNHSCISVAYASCGTVRAAAVYNPYVDEMFTAVRGEGAYINGQPIHAHDGELADSIVCFGTSPYALLGEKTFDLAKLAFDNSLDIRRQGSAELDLCSVAAGRAGVYFELSLSMWDFAAGMLIVEEAGGVCLTAEGAALRLDGNKSSVIAGGKRAVNEFIALIRNQYHLTVTAAGDNISGAIE